MLEKNGLVVALLESLHAIPPLERHAAVRNLQDVIVREHAQHQRHAPIEAAPMDDLRSTAARGWRGPAEPSGRASVSRAAAKKTPKRAYDVHTRTARLHIRLDPAERDALDFLALKWNATRSDVVRSMIVGAAGQLDRLDAVDAGFDLIDAPIDDVFAGS